MTRFISALLLGLWCTAASAADISNGGGGAPSGAAGGGLTGSYPNPTVATVPATAMPALTGDCTTSAGAVATSCTKTGGVAFTGAATATFTTPAAWTPADGSGASLVFTSVSANWQRIGNMVFAYASFTYPTTADATPTTVSGFPVPFPAAAYSRQCTLTATQSGTATKFIPNPSASTGAFITNNLGTVTNAQMSASLVFLMCIYPAS